MSASVQYGRRTGIALEVEDGVTATDHHVNEAVQVDVGHSLKKCSGQNIGQVVGRQGRSGAMVVHEPGRWMVELT